MSWIWRDRIKINDIGEEERVHWGERQRYRKPLLVMSWLWLSRAWRGLGLSTVLGGGGRGLGLGGKGDCNLSDPHLKLKAVANSLEGKV